MAAAQTPAAAPAARSAQLFLPGRLVPRATSVSDPRQQYAVYLPSRYRTGERWPLLILMDPRGQALLPMERVVTVAERLGYLVLSSYHTRSDEFTDPNADALNAMLRDAERLFALDPHRIYLVGQSGTARANWIFGYALRGHVAGLIGFGASLPPRFLISPRPDGTPPPLVFYGGAGTRDYNYDEMWAMDTLLDRVNLPHRISAFDGRHSWPPAAHFTEAVEWVELQAMRFGLKARDSAWIDGMYRRELALADSLEAAGSPWHAWRRYRAIAADYAGLGDTAPAAAAAERLGKTRPVRRLEEALGDGVKRQLAWNDRLGRFLGEFRSGRPPELARSLDRLGIGELERRASDRDSVDAQAASRGLANLWIYAAFYEPRDYLVQGDPARALAILELADALRNEDPEVCYYRARALHRLGRDQDALDAIECIVAAGYPPDHLERDPELGPLLRDPGFQVFLARLRTTRPAAARVRLPGG